MAVDEKSEVAMGKDTGQKPIGVAYDAGNEIVITGPPVEFPDSVPGWEHVLYRFKKPGLDDGHQRIEWDGTEPGENRALDYDPDPEILEAVHERGEVIIPLEKLGFKFGEVKPPPRKKTPKPKGCEEIQIEDTWAYHWILVAIALLMIVAWILLRG
jgi:hypothetical protein